MATFSNAQAIYGLQATAAPVGTNVSGNQTVGIQPVVQQFSAANAAYSFRIAAATTLNSAVWTLADGTCVAGAGTPVISDGDGRDCEGITLPAMDSIYAFWLRCSTTNLGDVDVVSNDTKIPDVILERGSSLLMLSPNSFGDGAATFTFAKGGDTLDVVVIAKST